MYMGLRNLGLVGGVGTSGQTDLQRLIALSPSLLIWPANGAGWQGTSGGTLAASGQPLGLGADLSQLQGKTLAEWLASAPDLRSGGSVGLVGTATAAAYNSSTGVGSVTRAADLNNQSFVAWSGLAVSAYYMDIEATGSASLMIRNGTATGSQYLAVSAGTRTTIVIPPGSGSITITAQVNGTTAAFTLHAFEALPGNHLRAGTWASPSDAARGTFQNNAISFDGVDDYYSLLNAVPITTNMTVVRAFKRASAGINSLGLGENATGAQYDAFWATDNNIYNSLGGTGAAFSGGTGTGSYVLTSYRNATNQLMRRNGTLIQTVAAPSVTGSLSMFGRRTSSFNSGEISFLAVFPTELTGTNLALVEQIAASTNGAVLA